MKHYINDSIKIDFDVPTVIRDSMEIAEKADEEEHYGTYVVYAENIDTVAKNCYADGAITKEQWDLLLQRYVQ